MFFYVSFLRPPPTQASLTSPILITPQVANDLRTESCATDQDIYYDWVLAETKPGQQPRAFKKPIIKLMTWKNGNAYKEVPVPPPYGVREGQEWRLVLSAVPAGTPASIRIAPGRIYLDDEKIGKWHPFSVASMPVRFVSNARNVRGAPKQEQIERAYEFKVDWDSVDGWEGGIASPSGVTGIQEITRQVEALRVVQEEREEMLNVVNLLIREQTSFDLDKKIWDSGIGLSAWLVQSLNRRLCGPQGSVVDTPSSRLKAILGSQIPLRILELGAGTGIVAVVLAALRSRIANPGDRILTTDLESAIPLLQHNIDANEPTRSPKVSLKCSVLDWDQSLSYQLPDRRGFDLVMMADVTYNTASFPSLVQTLSDLRSLDPLKKPSLLLGYKERDEAERTLWDLTEAVGIKFSRVGSIPGHVFGDAPIEIWFA